MHGVHVAAKGDEKSHKQRAAQTVLSLFRALDRAGNDLLTREDVRGELNLGPRIGDIDINSDEIVMLREMRV